MNLKDKICNLCGSKAYDVLYPSTIGSDKRQALDYACTNSGHGEHFQVVKCSQCGLCYCSPCLEEAALSEEYKAVFDACYYEEREGRVKTFQRNLKNIAKYKTSGEMLDIGCAMGVFLNEARQQGWSVRGLEPSKWCVEEAKKQYNLDVFNGTTKDLLDMNQKFDVVTMWDVWEHVSDPLNTLKACRNILKDDGLLVFSTVDMGSLYAKMLGSKWPWLMKMHIYYFDKTTIKKYLDASGLRLVKMRTYKHIVSVNYLLHKLKTINQFLFYCLKAIKLILFFNRNFFIPIALGDFVEVYARKN